jgi:hypothetical protein
MWMHFAFSRISIWYGSMSPRAAGAPAAPVDCGTNTFFGTGNLNEPTQWERKHRRMVVGSFTRLSTVGGVSYHQCLGRVINMANFRCKESRLFF